MRIRYSLKAALLIGMRCDHPDIEDFLKIKQNNDKIKMANISILFTHEFMRAVITGSDYKLHFFVPETGEHIERTINAKDFFHKFCENNSDWAEPKNIGQYDGDIIFKQLELLES